MFKIPSYDELEKKESELENKRKEYQKSLFQKRKQFNTTGVDEDTSERSSSSTTTAVTKTSESIEKNLEIDKEQETSKKLKTSVVIDNDDNDDEDLLLNDFLSKNDHIIKSTKPADSDVFKKPQVPSIIVKQAPTTTTTVTATTSSNSVTGSGALMVNSKQRGNPVLKHIRNVQWKYSDTLVPDYCMTRTSCAFYLSMKYHLLNPTYIHQRIRELGRAYELRVLLVFVDVKEPRHCIKELERVCIHFNLTMILCWKSEEVARYLETYKAYEFKSAEAIMEKGSAATGSSTHSNNTNSANSSASNESNFVNNFTDFMCQIKSINKTDASTLRQTFGSIKEISRASKEQLTLCPGLGPLKVNRLYEIFRTPFLLEKKSDI